MSVQLPRFNSSYLLLKTLEKEALQIKESQLNQLAASYQRAPNEALRNAYEEAFRCLANEYRFEYICPQYQEALIDSLRYKMIPADYKPLRLRVEKENIW